MTLSAFAAQSLQQADTMQECVQVCQFEQTAVAGGAPWLYSALYELHTLEQNGANIPGVGDFRIPEIVGTSVRMLMAVIPMKDDLPAPVVSPISGGAISLTWTAGDREVKFSVFPNEIVRFRIEDDDVLDDQQVVLGNQRHVVDPLKWLYVSA